MSRRVWVIVNAGRLFAAAVSLLLMAAPAHSFLRWDYDDVEVAQRSELVVVGRIKDGSVRFVVHPRRGDEGVSWEHSAVLVVTQVLKGDLADKEIPVTIHYGLTPVAGGKLFYHWADRTLEAVAPAPAGPLRINDTANGPKTLAVQDAREDNLWFLRKGVGRPAGRADAIHVGVVDPEDIQPLALKDYFLAYLAPDPEKAVRDYAAQHPDILPRVQRYFDRVEVERIVAGHDPAERAQKLLPYFLGKLDGLHWRTVCEAEKALLACGDAAGPGLLKAFDAADASRREHILRMLGEIRYGPATDRLLALIAEHEKFWNGREVRPGWWNDDSVPERGAMQRAFAEMQYAADALEKIGDPRTEETLAKVRSFLKELAAVMSRPPAQPEEQPEETP